MYKHTAESILESTDKRFISQIDKDKYDNYNDRFREKTDIYTKQELENVVTEFDSIFEPVSGPNISIEGTIDGYMRNVQILGNTIQDPNNLKDIKSVGNKLEDGRYEIPLLIRGKNLLPLETREGYYNNGEFNPGKPVGAETVIANVEPIPCLPNTKYTISKTAMGRTSFYNSKGEYISDTINNHGITTFTTPDNCRYINIHEHVTSFDGISLIVGNNVGEYTPYVEDELTSIILDNPLEKINNISDRILKKDGVWGVEKRIGYITLDGYNMPEWARVISDEEGKNTVIAHTELYTYDSIHLNECMSNLLKPLNTVWFEDTDCFTVSEDGRLYVRLSKDKLETLDEYGINDYFKENKLEIKYVLANPQFIPLPEDKQIMLRTLEGYTNIDLLTELPGTIEGEICRTLDSSVITSNEVIEDKIKDVEEINKLQDMTSTKVSTNKQFISVEETNSGYLDDVVLEGETLVNLLKVESGFELNTDYTTFCFNITSLIRPLTVGKVYTYIPLNTPSYIYSLYLGNSNSTNVLIRETDIKPISFVAQDNCEGIQLTPHFYSKTPINIDDMQNVKLLLLEGDYTDIPLSYFNGLKSVGEDTEKVQISTNNENLFDSSLLPRERLEDDGYYHFRTSTSNSTSRFFFGFISQDKQTVIDNIDFNIIVDYSKYDLSGGHLLLGINGDIKDDKITIPVSELNIPRTKLYKGLVCEKISHNHYRIKDVSLSTNLKGELTNHKSNTKELLYLDTDGKWKKPILRKVNEKVKDVVKRHSDGKYYFHKHCEEIIIDGNLPWQNHTTIQDTETYCYFITHISKPYNYFNPDILNLKCDLFNPVNRRDIEIIDDNAICVNNGTGLFYYNIKIKKSLLSTPDVAGLKAYLNANNLTVVHQGDEEVYECTPIDLISYNDVTNIVVNSGAINPKISVRVNNNVSNVINSVKNKISILESDFYGYVIEQNKSMLESNYNIDSVNLKVDIVTKSQEVAQNEIDYDIYELMYKNIMIGKHNYGRLKMEEMIDFYTMVDKLSLEMASTLFELIEEHHFEIEE